MKWTIFWEKIGEEYEEKVTSLYWVSVHLDVDIKWAIRYRI